MRKISLRGPLAFVALLPLRLRLPECGEGLSRRYVQWDLSFKDYTNAHFYWIHLFLVGRPEDVVAMCVPVLYFKDYPAIASFA
jgi:hypothetical protein